MINTDGKRTVANTPHGRLQAQRIGAGTRPTRDPVKGILASTAKIIDAEAAKIAREK